MTTWMKLVRLLCLAFIAFCTMQARVYAQGFCHGQSPQQMPVEVASDEEGFRHFRMGCAPGNQIDTLISRVNASIRNPADHVNMEHFIDSNLRKIGYMCRVGSGDRRNMIHNSRFGMSIQDYSDRYCQEGEAHPYVIPGTVLRIPATGIKTPTQVVRDLTAEVQARASIDPSYLDTLYQRLETQERRTDATPITREARLGFTAAIRAKLSTLAIAPVATRVAPVQSIPVRAGSTRVVYAYQGNDVYRGLFYFTLCLSFCLFGLLVMAKRSGDRKSLRSPAAVNGDREEEIRQLSSQLNQKIEQFEAKSVETAKLVTELNKVKAEKESLKDFVDAITDRALQIFGGQHPTDLKSMTRLVMTVLDLADRYEKLRKSYDALMQRMKKGALAERYSRLPETFGGHEDDILRIFNQLESSQKSLVASEQQHQTYDMLSQQYLGQKLTERVLEDILTGKVAVRPPGAVLLSGSTLPGMPARLSVPPPASLPSFDYGDATEESAALRVENEGLRVRVAEVLGFADQLYTTMRELARTIGVDVEQLPTFDLLEVKGSSDQIMALHDLIMKRHDEIDQELVMTKSAYSELQDSKDTLAREYEAASELAAEQAEIVSELRHELAAREHSLDARLNELNLMKVQLNDAQATLNSAEGIRRGLTFRMTELDSAKKALEQERDHLLENFTAIDRENGFYRQFCENSGGELVLDMLGLSESIASAPAVMASPCAADASLLKQQFNRFIKEVLDLPARARDYGRAPVEVAANVVAMYPIAARGG